MGRILTPTYRIEYRSNALAMGKIAADKIGVDGKPVNTMAWRGKATEARLADWRKTFNESMKAGGANEHLTKSLGFIEHTFYAAIVHQATGKVVARVQAPTFEII